MRGIRRGNPRQTVLEQRSFSDETGTEAAAQNLITPAVKMDDTDACDPLEVLSREAEGLDVRLERIAKLREAIAAGTYNVSPSAVAEAILSHLQERGRDMIGGAAESGPLQPRGICLKRSKFNHST